MKDLRNLVDNLRRKAIAGSVGLALWTGAFPIVDKVVNGDDWVTPVIAYNTVNFVGGYVNGSFEIEEERREFENFDRPSVNVDTSRIALIGGSYTGDKLTREYIKNHGRSIAFDYEDTRYKRINPPIGAPSEPGPLRLINKVIEAYQNNVDKSFDEEYFDTLPRGPDPVVPIPEKSYHEKKENKKDSEEKIEEEKPKKKKGKEGNMHFGPWHNRLSPACNKIDA